MFFSPIGSGDCDATTAATCRRFQLLKVRRARSAPVVWRERQHSWDLLRRYALPALRWMLSLLLINWGAFCCMFTLRSQHLGHSNAVCLISQRQHFLLLYAIYRN